MKYHELLSQYIDMTKLSLSQIEEKMREKGFSTNKAYISKLQNGKLPPAGEDITRALAEVTGGDPNALIFAGYIERAPAEIKEALQKVEDIDDLLKNFFKFIMSIIGNEPLLDRVMEMRDLNEVEVKFVKEMDTADLFDDLESEEKLELLGDLIDFLNEKAKTENPLLNMEMENLVQEQMIKVPVLGTITAGQPIDRIEDHEKYELVERDLVRGRECFILRVRGDSMIGDHVYDGDRVVVIVQEEVTATDIAVVAVNGHEATLKRVKVQEDRCMLIPSNPSMEPMLYPAKDIHIIGKVVEVRHRL